MLRCSCVYKYGCKTVNKDTCIVFCCGNFVNWGSHCTPLIFYIMIHPKLKELEEYFSDIKFEKSTHTYKVGKTKLKSVSGCLSMIGNKFDPSISKYSAIKEKTTQENVLKRWDKIKRRSLKKGNYSHDFAEDYINGKVYREKGYSNSQTRGILQYLDSLPKHIVYGIPEIKVYNLKYRIAGTMDLPLYNQETEKYIISDWKTNVNIYKNFNYQKLKKPFDFMLDMPANKYQLQLNFYEFMIKDAGFDVESKNIVWLNHDERTGKEYKTFDINDYQELIKKWLDDNRKFN